VAIFGAGPVGLLAVHSAMIRGASLIYCIDKDKKRLDMAKSLGAMPINFLDGDPVLQIREHLGSLKPLNEAMRPGEGKVLQGVDCVIDAVGYQAFDRARTGPVQGEPGAAGRGASPTSALPSASSVSTR
jgi:glutathione-independent formaldehyde dehydrogenase